MKNIFSRKKHSKLKIIATFVTLLFIVLYACQDDLWDLSWERHKTEIIEYAKAWYETNRPETIGLSSLDGTDQVLMKAEWTNAFATRNENYEVVETNLMSQGRVIFLDESCMQKYSETNDPRYKQSYTRIVFRTDRKTSETVGFLMTVVPNLEWLEKSKFKPFKDVTYLYRSKHFGGKILFHEMDGRYSNGWVYEDGKVTAEVGSLDVDADDFSFRSMGCTWQSVYNYFLVCTTWFTAREDGPDHEGETICRVERVFAGVAYVCYYIGGTPGGYAPNTGTGTTPNNIGPNLSKIIKKHSLTQSQIKSLSDILDEWLKECGYAFMHGQIVGKGARFNDVLISNRVKPGTAGYEPSTGNLLFGNAAAIEKYLFGEELVHLYQRSYYGDAKMNSYLNTAYGNIEFEAKVIQDLLCLAKSISTGKGGCMYVGRGKNYHTSYSKWIDALVKDGSPFGVHFPTMHDIMNKKVDGLGYWNFLSDFVKIPDTPYFNAETNLSLYPSALDNINRYSVNICLAH